VNGLRPAIEPALKRSLGFTGPPPRQEALNANVLIQIRPVNSFAVADKSPVGALNMCPMRQSWEPGERRRDGPAIHQVHGKGIVAYGQAASCCFPEFSL